MNESIVHLYTSIYVHTYTHICNNSVCLQCESVKVFPWNFHFSAPKKSKMAKVIERDSVRGERLNADLLH